MKKILLVDDSAEMRRLLNITLRNYYDIVEARSGEDAISMARAYQPHAILLDIVMPGQLDGLQVLKSIRQDASTSAPLIAMVTARSTAMDCNLSLQLGADAYFVKPFSPLKIVHWLQQNLH